MYHTNYIGGITLCKEISRQILMQPDHLTMKNVSHKKTWNSDMTQPHVETLTITITKNKQKDTSDKYFIKLDIRRDSISSSLVFYEFKMALFSYGKTEEFLLFVRNFKMTIAASGTLTSVTKIQYICTLVHGEALCQFESFFLTWNV